MKTLRRWHLIPSQDLTIQLAADARLSNTDYSDDQIWELLPAMVDTSALVLQTRYGGRATSATIIPHWSLDGRTIHLSQAYAKPPIITALVPGYIQLQAKITSHLALQAEYWVMDSHAIGARFTLVNADNKPMTVRVAMTVHVQVKERVLHQTKLRHPDGTYGLLMGRVDNINPVIVLEEADAPLIPTPIHIERSFTVPANKKFVVRWVHAALPDVHKSLMLAQHWLRQDWHSAFIKIAKAAQSNPIIETGDSERDLLLALSYHHLIQSLLKPTGHFPYHSFVMSRQTDDGYSRSADGSDHPRTWNGQEPPAAYLLALALAPIEAKIAQGIIRNYIAVQQADGDIDWKPGLGGQRRGFSCLPVLARLTWETYQYTGDTQFLKDTLPALFDFFQHWLDDDLDRDDLPEWADERQTGYAFMPTFGTTQAWAQGADIRYVETPDMAAYLLSEAYSLVKIAETLDIQPIQEQLQRTIVTLEHILENLWHDDHYAYRDYETHSTTTTIPLIDEMPGDEGYHPQQTLQPPARLIIRISGGRSHVPRCKLVLKGLDQHGNTVDEVSDENSLNWHHGNGFYTSRSVFSRIDTIHIEGLSRVYRISASTIDLTRIDLNRLMPLWTDTLSQQHRDSLLTLLGDPTHFWRENGIAMTSAQDAAFDPSNAKGSGAIWLFWQTVLGGGLLAHGETERAAQLLDRLLTLQAAILQDDGTFFEFYHADETQGLGARGHLAGIAPLHLFMRTVGVFMITSKRVRAGGAYHWDHPVTVTQHGVKVTRSRTGTNVEFPSGSIVTFDDDEVHDINAPPAQTPAAPEPTTITESPTDENDRE